MADERIGRLFPAGGPVPPELVVGREGDIAELQRRVEEGIHTLLTGERRIGKTTVCNAVCSRLSVAGSTVIQVEVPESADATALLQLIVDRFSVSYLSRTRRLFRTAQPLLQKLLGELGIPLDLNQLEPSELPTTSRTVLALPLTLARETGNPVVFFLDELQRAVDYAGGEELLGHLVDLYSGNPEAVLLVDGSNERILDQMMADPIRFGKLVDSWPLDPRISLETWRRSLPGRFGQAGLTVEPEALEKLISFGAGQPYPTMSAARYAALNARKVGGMEVGAFEVEYAIAEARRHLEEDR